MVSEMTYAPLNEGYHTRNLSSRKILLISICYQSFVSHLRLLRKGLRKYWILPMSLTLFINSRNKNASTFPNKPISFGLTVPSRPKKIKKKPDEQDSCRYDAEVNGQKPRRQNLAQDDSFGKGKRDHGHHEGQNSPQSRPFAQKRLDNGNHSCAFEVHRNANDNSAGTDHHVSLPMMEAKNSAGA
jgi:hypothetical protein